MKTAQTALTEGTPRLALEAMGCGELVVFLHGIGGNRRQWRQQLPAFATEYLACAYDGRGYGESDDYPGPLAFASLAEDVLRVLAFFGRERAHLVGHSMGGRVARCFALKYPNRVISLVLANTSAGFAALTAEQTAAFLRQRQEPLLQGKTPAQLAPDLVKNLLGPTPGHGVYEEAVGLIAALHPQSYLKTLEASVKDDRTAAVEALAMPVLVIAAEQDTLYGIDQCRQMAARIAGAQFAVIREAGHLSNLEQPRQFNEVVLSFLRSLRAP